LIEVVVKSFSTRRFQLRRLSKYDAHKHKHS
jgi:hypothetical protein